MNDDGTSFGRLESPRLTMADCVIQRQGSAGVWSCANYAIDLSTPKIMAIINVTENSFSGDGFAGKREQIRARAERLIADGADILDVGGESTRPGVQPVSLQEELDRIVPVVESLADLGFPISVDTMKPEVMKEAIKAGAAIINDVRALEAPGAIEVVSQSTVGVCLMHMKGEPRTMQQAPRYDDVVQDVAEYLLRRADALHSVGVSRNRVCIDPGFGFGKTLEHNIALFQSLEKFLTLDCPLLIGVSRKSMLGEITGKPVSQRTTASAIAAVLAISQGASIVRVHDVAETRDALSVWQVLRGESEARQLC